MLDITSNMSLLPCLVLQVCYDWRLISHNSQIYYCYSLYLILYDCYFLSLSFSDSPRSHESPTYCIAKQSVSPIARESPVKNLWSLQKNIELSVMSSKSGTLSRARRSTIFERSLGDFGDYILGIFVWENATKLCSLVRSQIFFFLFSSYLFFFLIENLWNKIKCYDYNFFIYNLLFYYLHKYLQLKPIYLEKWLIIIHYCLVDVLTFQLSTIPL